jgi:hypothetical protein
MNDLQLTNAGVREHPCDQCPFTDHGIDLGLEKMAEIEAYLRAGQNHLCHKDRTHKTVCRGGRRYQLQVWHGMGLIEAPTDEALAKKMRELGIEPASHVCVKMRGGCKDDAGGGQE